MFQRVLAVIFLSLSLFIYGCGGGGDGDDGVNTGDAGDTSSNDVSNSSSNEEENSDNAVSDALTRGTLTLSGADTANIGSTYNAVYQFSAFEDLFGHTGAIASNQEWEDIFVVGTETIWFSFTIVDTDDSIKTIELEHLTSEATGTDENVYSYILDCTSISPCPGVTFDRANSTINLNNTELAVNPDVEDGEINMATAPIIATGSISVTFGATEETDTSGSAGDWELSITGTVNGSEYLHTPRNISGDLASFDFFNDWVTNDTNGIAQGVKDEIERVTVTNTDTEIKIGIVFTDTLTNPDLVFNYSLLYTFSKL